MRSLILFMICAQTILANSLSAAIVPQRATAPVPEVPVGILCSSRAPKGSIWIRAHIIEQIDDDTFLIGDRTGQITLFLPSDDLLAYNLQPKMEILILGSVDVSPVRPEKNEFYAERIMLPPEAIR